jgi:nicotinate-nucleotide adenylyltransferase
MSTSRERIAIFGGAFDPPHMGHLVIIHALLNSLEVDKIWLVPSGKRTDKTCRGTAHDRFVWASTFVREMLPSSNLPKEIFVSRIEVDHATPLEGAVELFALLNERYPLCDFSLAVGDDVLPHLSQWRHPEELKVKVPLLVVDREGASDILPSGYKIKRISSFFHSSLSSSLIKSLGDNGTSLNGLLSPGVLEQLQVKKFFTRPA